MTTKLFDFPLFPPGPHRANDGTIVNLDAAGLQDLVRNTRFAVAKGLLKPPVGFRHPAARDFFAKGHITDAQYINGVAHAFVAQPKFIDDAKNGNVLEYSGEIGFVEYTEEGVGKKVGPCIVGIGLLGDERPGIKDPRRKPLSQLVKEQAFGEALTPAQTWEIAEELRKAGVVAQTYDAGEENRYCFSEMIFDSQDFKEEKTHMPIDDNDLAKIGGLIAAALKPLQEDLGTVKTEIGTVKTETETQFKKFSEGARRESEAETWADQQDEKVPLGKVASELRRDIARKAAGGNLLTFAEVKAAYEAITPGVITKEERKPNDDGDEPEALAKIRPSMFSEASKHDNVLTAAWEAALKFKPERFGQFRHKPQREQMAALKDYAVERHAS